MDNEQHSQNINPLSDMLEGLSDDEAIAKLDEMAREHRMETFTRMAKVIIDERDKHRGEMLRLSGLTIPHQRLTPAECLALWAPRD